MIIDLLYAIATAIVLAIAVAPGLAFALATFAGVDYLLESRNANHVTTPWFGERNPSEGTKKALRIWATCFLFLVAVVGVVALLTLFVQLLQRLL